MNTTVMQVWESPLMALIPPVADTLLVFTNTVSVKLLVSKVIKNLKEGDETMAGQK